MNGLCELFSFIKGKATSHNEAAALAARVQRECSNPDVQMCTTRARYTCSSNVLQKMIISQCAAKNFATF